jgi:hypothetical protein
MTQHTRPKKPRKRAIIGGVDTHADTHHAAVTLTNGGRIADAEFPPPKPATNSCWHG